MTNGQVKFVGKAQANDPLNCFSGPTPVYSYLDEGEAEVSVKLQPAKLTGFAALERTTTDLRLTAAKEKLGPNALSLLADIAERLARGAKEHGDFEKPRTAREWSKEAYEEDLDALVYRTLRVKAAA